MMNEKQYKEVTEALWEYYPDMIFYDGLEGGLIGHVQIFNKSVALYDYNLCVESLMENDGSTYEMVTEHLQTNSMGAYLGENTPGFFFPPEEMLKESKPSLLETISMLSNEEREELFGMLKREFCIFCARETPGRTECHCLNDE